VSHLEFLAAITALLGVLFTALGKTIGWSFGIIGALFYVFIFFDSQLYAEAVLQAFYVIMGFYGWLQWRNTAVFQQKLQAISQPVHVMFFSVLIIGVGTFAVGLLLDSYSDTNVPFLDAALGISGLVVTWQMAKKQLESWIWWIFVDLCSSGLFYYKELIATSILYLFFAGFAAFGFVNWKKEMALQ